MNFIVIWLKLIKFPQLDVGWVFHLLSLISRKWFEELRESMAQTVGQKLV